MKSLIIGLLFTSAVLYPTNASFVNFNNINRQSNIMTYFTHPCNQFINYFYRGFTKIIFGRCGNETIYISKYKPLLFETNIGNPFPYDKGFINFKFTIKYLKNFIFYSTENNLGKTFIRIFVQKVVIFCGIFTIKINQAFINMISNFKCCTIGLIEKRIPPKAILYNGIKVEVKKSDLVNIPLYTEPLIPEQSEPLIPAETEPLF